LASAATAFFFRSSPKVLVLIAPDLLPTRNLAPSRRPLACGAQVAHEEAAAASARRASPVSTAVDALRLDLRSGWHLELRSFAGPGHLQRALGLLEVALAGAAGGEEAGGGAE
jgi:hypothetical protein